MATKLGQYLKIPLPVLGTIWMITASVVGMVYKYGVTQAELNKEVIHLSKKVAHMEQTLDYRLSEGGVAPIRVICKQ